MSNERLDELAALRPLGFLTEAEEAELLQAADTETLKLTHAYDEVAARLALETPQVPPPDSMRKQIFAALPATAAGSKIIRFSSWIPYAIAACLMALGILQARQIKTLKSRVVTLKQNVDRLSKSNALIGLRLATLEARDAAYVSSKIMVAWDPNDHRGVVSMQNLPAPDAAHDYQLWVLDPEAPSPISAGLIKSDQGSRHFTVNPLTTQNPGFAITLEPAGGSPAPTSPILFAVAPGQ